jgi:hypothetical protein
MEKTGWLAAKPFTPNRAQIQTPDGNTGRGTDEYASGAVSSPTGYYIRKYYDPTSLTNFQSGLNLILIRYADVLLMYAEAKNELGQLDAGVWDKTIKPIRNRAGFTDAAALNFPGGAQTALRDVYATSAAANWRWKA